MSATLAATDRQTLDNTHVQLQAGGRVGTEHPRGRERRARAAAPVPATGCASGRDRVQASHWYSGGWADSTDAGNFPANGFIANDLIGTAGRGGYGGYNRAVCRRLGAARGRDGVLRRS